MVANISQKYKECPKESLIKTKEKLHKTINPHYLKVMRIYLFVISDSYLSYFISSKTTLTDYQCVSTGCCTHVAKTEITNTLQNRCKGTDFFPNNQKKTQKKHKMMQSLTCPKAFYAFLRLYLYFNQFPAFMVEPHWDIVNNIFKSSIYILCTDSWPKSYFYIFKSEVC